jgi:hypothetical protein
MPILALAVAVGVGVSALSAPASAAPRPVGSLGTFTALGLSGVSPHADLMEDGSVRLYFPSPQTGGTAVATCTLAGNCSIIGSIDRAADLTYVVLTDGSRRAYAIELDPETKFKEIYTAPLSADGLTLGERVFLGISSDGAGAWGVPDAVLLPDGRVRIYWVEPGAQGFRGEENIVSATSTDVTGTVFVRDEGTRTTGGLVDFEVLRAEPGNWLAIMSTSPADLPQRLLVGTSDDGLTWQINLESLTSREMSYLDPTGIPTGDDTFLVYYATAPNVLGDREYTLEQATLTADVNAATRFIERFYMNILGRPADEAGLGAWLEVINTQSASAVALGFLNSAEFKNRGLDDAAFVDILYRTLFDRAGDEGGTSYWLEQLGAGKLRDMVIWGFLRAEEFNTLSDSFGVTALSAADESAYGVRAFTERFYTVVLGRHPDQAGFDGWVSGLSAQTLSGGDLAKAFFLSAEYVAQGTSDSNFVDTAYQAFFGRAADAAGKQGWLDVLSGGESREYVLNGFIGSAEFVALAASYGISASKTAGATDRTAVGTAAVRETPKVGDAEAIPALPMLTLFLLSGLVGLFGMLSGHHRYSGSS